MGILYNYISKLTVLLEDFCLLLLFFGRLPSPCKSFKSLMLIVLLSFIFEDCCGDASCILIVFVFKPERISVMSLDLSFQVLMIF